MKITPTLLHYLAILSEKGLLLEPHQEAIYFNINNRKHKIYNTAPNDEIGQELIFIEQIVNNTPINSTQITNSIDLIIYLYN
jgi:hypothetical protein